MTKVTYTGGARAWRTRAYGGLTFATGETKDVDEDAADWLVENHDFERTPDADVEGEDEDDTSAEAEAEAEVEEEPESEAPEPLDGTVSEIEDALATGEYDDDLVDLYNAERDHENRSTAIGAIQDRRDELREQNQSESEGEG